MCIWSCMICISSACALFLVLQSCMSPAPACRTSPHALKVQQLLTNGKCVSALWSAGSDAELGTSTATQPQAYLDRASVACQQRLLCSFRALFHCNPQGLCNCQSLACIKACRILERGWCKRGKSRPKRRTDLSVFARWLWHISKQS